MIVVHSKAEWDELHASNAGKTIVVDFTATWCGPCRMIGPYFEELSTEFESVIFLKVRLLDPRSAPAGRQSHAYSAARAANQGSQPVVWLVGAARRAVFWASLPSSAPAEQGHPRPPRL